MPTDEHNPGMHLRTLAPRRVYLIESWPARPEGQRERQGVSAREQLGCDIAIEEKSVPSSIAFGMQRTSCLFLEINEI